MSPEGCWGPSPGPPETPTTSRFQRNNRLIRRWWSRSPSERSPAQFQMRRLFTSALSKYFHVLDENANVPPSRGRYKSQTGRTRTSCDRLYLPNSVWRYGRALICDPADGVRRTSWGTSGQTDSAQQDRLLFIQLVVLKLVSHSGGQNPEATAP